MRLNGWQRIGVVVSVLWALSVGSVATYEMFGGAPFGALRFVESVPDKNRATVAIYDPFDKKTHSFQPEKTVLRVKTVLLSVVVPIGFGWFLVYAVLWALRWVKSGFHEQ